MQPSDTANRGASSGTEQRLLDRIRADEERWRLGLDVNGVGVWDLDLVTRTLIGSRLWAEITGLAHQSEASGTPLPVSRFHPDDLLPFLSEWKALLKGDRRALECGIRLSINTNYRYMRLRGRVVRRSPAGEPERVLGTIVDIHEPTLHIMQAANATKLESIGQLAAGIAHEINTPTQYVGDNMRFLGDTFQGLLNCLGAVARAADDDRTLAPGELHRLLESADFAYLQQEIPKAIEQSLDGIGRIARIVSAMKEFSHPGQDLTPTDLNHAIANTIVVATNEWKYVAEMSTDFDAALPAVAVMPGEFNQVILNMIVNAAHAIAERFPAGGPQKGLIHVTTRQTAGWAVILIADNGCGIPPEVQPKIFDPFFTTKPVGKGTGQGLSIAHNVIVTKHRGSIEVTSEPGVGTSFTIRLPL